MNYSDIKQLAALTASMKRTIPASHKDALEVHQATTKLDDAFETAIELAKLTAVVDYINEQREDGNVSVKIDEKALDKRQGLIRLYERRLKSASDLKERLIDIAAEYQITQSAEGAGAINSNLVSNVVKSTWDLTHSVDSHGNVSVFADGKSIDQAIQSLAKAQDTRHLFGSGKLVKSAHPQKGYMGVNPWAKATFNLTQQGRIVRDNPALAEKLKAAAKAA